MTNSEARAKAKELGYKPTRDFPFRTKRNELVFEKDGKFITNDYSVHRGRGWKMFDRDGNRIGTYNEDLTIRIGP
ncbi:MAG: toxin C-terminal domain-containing protein [Reyranellaceae bacterium]